MGTRTFNQTVHAFFQLASVDKISQAIMTGLVIEFFGKQTLFSNIDTLCNYIGRLTVFISQQTAVQSAPRP